MHRPRDRCVTYSTSCPNNRYFRRLNSSRDTSIASKSAKSTRILARPGHVEYKAKNSEDGEFDAWGTLTGPAISLGRGQFRIDSANEFRPMRSDGKARRILPSTKFVVPDCERSLSANHPAGFKRLRTAVCQKHLSGMSPPFHATASKKPCFCVKKTNDSAKESTSQTTVKPAQNASTNVNPIFGLFRSLFCCHFGKVGQVPVL